jgi:hypothetical protein
VGRLLPPVRPLGAHLSGALVPSMMSNDEGRGDTLPADFAKQVVSSAIPGRAAHVRNDDGR